MIDVFDREAMSKASHRERLTAYVFTADIFQTVLDSLSTDPIFWHDEIASTKDTMRQVLTMLGDELGNWGDEEIPDFDMMFINKRGK